MGKKKRWISAGLYALAAVIAAVTVLAGCSKKEETARQEEGQAPVELTILMPGSLELSGNSPIYKEIRQKLNVDLKIISSGWNDYDQKLNMMIASGELPDLFFNYSLGMFMGEYMGVYKRWIQEGILLPISDHTDGYPNLAKWLEPFEDEKKASGGKHYSLYLLNSANKTSNGRAMLIRTDWLNKLGLPMPKTMDDLYNVAKEFTLNDPDGNGSADTFGIGAGENLQDLYPIINPFNTSLLRARKADGSWTLEVVSDEMKEALRYLRQLYTERIMDPEFMLINQEQKIERFVSGKTGIIHAASYNNVYEGFKKAYPDRDPATMFTYIPHLLEGKNGFTRIDGNPNWWGAYSINAQSSAEKRDKALKLLDFLLSEEGMKLVSYGVEDVHYKQEGDAIVSLLPEGQKLGDADPGAALRGIATSYVPSMEEDELYKRDLQAGFESYGDPSPDPLRFLDLSFEALDLYKQLFDYTGQAITMLVIQSQNYDEDWDRYREEWMSMAGTKFLELLDQEAKAAGY
ncbi:hypothetical protein B1A99_06930 [Cohnella sp. CIP 111063]|uniref:extracellular solute-binding protein n=1 Tax=unclassified Cohnella TaxID=2636738 RepID=UPI000B8C1FA9|nr:MULTISPECIES: extracellular solute-binding protein [unclassified Cohnella]OXS61240.1 hypothetical protein B1A99_06930 [Cohnella sp. CIP 111063]PRX73811.1 multiple sugar transport system substrate-binding protein [Cohnella sp. SGD-V74]